MIRCFIASLLLLTLLLLNSCGGGANTAGASINQSATLIQGKAFGYYGDCNQSCFTEYSSTVSLYHTSPWSHDFPAIAAGLTAAISANKSIVLSIPDGDSLVGDCRERISGFLSYLDSQGLLKNIFAIYPKDEYNLNSKLTEAQIRAANKCVREVIQNYEGTRGKPLYGIYTCPDPWVAIDDLDIIACDHYEIGDAMLTNYLQKLKAYGKPIFLIPGGACPWNYNPFAMVNAANRDDQIIGIEAFIWLDGYDSSNVCGIKSSVTLPLYQHVLAQPGLKNH